MMELVAFSKDSRRQISLAGIFAFWLAEMPIMQRYPVLQGPIQHTGTTGTKNLGPLLLFVVPAWSFNAGGAIDIRMSQNKERGFPFFRARQSLLACERWGLRHVDSLVL